MKYKPYLIAFFFFLIDFLSKQVVIHTLKLEKSIKVIDNFFYLTYTQNKGAAFSILKDERILLLILTVLIIFIIHKYIDKERLNKLEIFFLGMIIGGIIGNFFDRLVYGYVIDFLDFYLFGYNYPVFNLADSFIVIGIILMLVISFRKEHVWKK